MKTTLIAAVAALTLSAVSGSATPRDVAFGGFSGAATSSVFAVSGSATGGIAFPGVRGTTLVSNQSGAIQQSGAMTELKFVEIDGQRGNNVVRDVDGIRVVGKTSAYTVGEDFSTTTIIDRGTGTTGLGGGFAGRLGGATANVAWVGFGSAQW